MTPTAFDLARDFLQRRLSVFPVPQPDGTHDGKVPTMAWRIFQTRLATESELRRLFAGNVNVAIVTGALSGVVVIDADTLNALRWCTRHLPYTPWQTRTGKGFHLYYGHPGGAVRNRARIETGAGRLAIDVRGDGGYVIAPGSLHASGAPYEFAGDWSVPRSALPMFSPDWVARPRPVESRPPFHVSTGSVIDRARKYLASMPVPEIGDGSDGAVLYAAARLVRGFALSPSDAAALLWDWAGGRPGWTREWVERKVANAERYGSELMGALR